MCIRLLMRAFGKIFVKNEKKPKNLLTNLDFYAKILNCIIIACSMATYAPNDGFAACKHRSFVQNDDCATPSKDPRQGICGSRGLSDQAPEIRNPVKRSVASTIFSPRALAVSGTRIPPYILYR